MFLFKKENRAANGIAALGFYPDGVGVARVVRKPDDSVLLDACEFIPVSGAGAWRGAVEDARERSGLDKSRCSIVIEDGSYAILLVEAPDVPAEELKAAVRWRIRELIEFHIDDAVVDVFDVPEKKSGGRSRMMYVVAARAPLLGEKTDIAQQANLSLGVVDIPELAQRNVAACLPEDADGVAMLYLSAKSGLITLTRQATLYLTRRLDSGFTAVAGETSINGRVEKWLDMLVVEIQRSLDYYENNFAQPPIAALVLAPMEHAVVGMEAYISRQLGISVRGLDLNTAVESRAVLSPHLQARCFPVVGAALRCERASL